MEKILVLGASKGLGASVVDELAAFHPHLFLVGRNEGRLTDIVSRLGFKDVRAEFETCDVSKSELHPQLFQTIERFKPQRIINLIGGGPYGKYSEKEWKDHYWAFEVNFLFSARLLHFALSSLSLDNLKQIVFTGSSIAEDRPDPNASSYSASKHALRGLIYSVRAEKTDIDLRLYSPPYMDTGMLPPKAWPRESAEVLSPKVVAQHMVRWIFSPPDDKFHVTYDGAQDVR